jgi:hypothetical protein
MSWKTTVIGIVTAFFAFVAFDPQWFPPVIVSLAKFAMIGGLAGLGIFGKDSDVTGGTRDNGTMPSPTKFTGILLVLILLPAVASAQTSADPQLPSQFVSAGTAYNQASTPQIQGWGSYAHQISGPLYSYSTYDVTALPGTPVPGKPVLPTLQYSARTGVAVHVTNFGRLSLWGLGDAGVAATGETVVGSFSGGGFGAVQFGKGWAAMLVMRIVRNAVSGTQYVPEIGIGYGVR